jgi:hypothetical protein
MWAIVHTLHTYVIVTAKEQGTYTMTVGVATVILMRINETAVHKTTNVEGLLYWGVLEEICLFSSEHYLLYCFKVTFLTNASLFFVMSLYSRLFYFGMEFATEPLHLASCLILPVGSLDVKVL